MIVGNRYWEGDALVEVVIQWGLKSRGETYGGPRNVMVERLDGSGITVRPFRGLRVAYEYDRGNRIPWRAPPDLDAPELAAWEAERMRPCGTCGGELWLPPATDPGEWWSAHDPCIANLPGIVFACCGHGVGERFAEDTTRPVRVGGVPHDSCYVVFRDGLTLYGNAARAAMEMLGGSPPPAPAGARPHGERFIVPE